ncbi:MAG: SRPBCC domain-containing protein [Pseudomonadota bacterium]
MDPTKRALWFAGGTGAEKEGKLDLVFDHDKLSADPVPYPPEYAKHKGAVSHECVVRVEAPRLLSYTWNEGKEGLVTFEIFPEGSKTRLVLTHTGISGPGALAGFGSGWLSHLTVLERRLAGGVVRDFWALHAGSRAAVQAQLGKV